ncbi:MAG: hypothetical protein IK031_02505, partial [Bacteroidales bacterium]|nr:hypothetical protein [Bacteroidales bacterium]
SAFDPCLTEVQTFYESMFRDQGYPIKYLCFTLGKEEGDSSVIPSAPSVILSGGEAGVEESPSRFISPTDFDPDYWRSIEGNRTLFGRDTAETRRQKLRKANDLNINE